MEKEILRETYKSISILTSRSPPKKTSLPDFFSFLRQNTLLGRITISLIWEVIMALNSGSGRRPKPFCVHLVTLHNAPIQSPIFRRMSSF